jgi:hypothetical protein
MSKVFKLLGKWFLPCPVSCCSECGEYCKKFGQAEALERDLYNLFKDCKDIEGLFSEDAKEKVKSGKT